MAYTWMADDPGGPIRHTPGIKLETSRGGPLRHTPIAVNFGGHGSSNGSVILTVSDYNYEVIRIFPLFKAYSLVSG
jgi:hypothetical protein